METLSAPAPAIAFAERLGDGVVVAFVDGRSALYSAVLLYKTIDDARELTGLRGDRPQHPPKLVGKRVKGANP